jgi:PAS domain S-box-containing protein
VLPLLSYFPKLDKMPGTNIVAQPVQVLIVDDDEDDYMIVKDMLQSISYPVTTTWAYSYNDALQHVKSGQYDVFIVDFRLGGKTGLDLMTDAAKFHSDTPFIFLTGAGSAKIDALALKAGATDYLVKGEMNEEKLDRSIRYAMERSKVIAALRLSETKYRTVFENSKDAIFIADHTGIILQTNSVFREMLGFTAEVPGVLNIADLVTTEQQKTLVTDIIKHCKEIKDLETEFILADGVIRIGLLSISCSTNESGESFFQCFLHDITELRKSERNLFQIEKLAAVGRLVRTLAHEVRNPLNNINLSIDQLEELIRETVTDTSLLTYTEIVSRNSGYINSLITELLHSLRHTEINIQRWPVHDIFYSAMAKVKDRLDLKGIQIKVVLPPEDMYVNIDLDKMTSAFLNLLTNAIEAIDHNTGVIILSAERGRDQVLVKIQDNGMGIPAESLGRLFEPYYTTKRNGMGLGMVATLNILQAHNATIEVRSEEGKGTAFTILFNTENT